MARRIELPSADALFGDMNGGPPVARTDAAEQAMTATPRTTKAARKKTAASRQPERAKTKDLTGVAARSKSKGAARGATTGAVNTTAPATPQRSRAHTSARPRAAEVQRIDRLASELDALPIESLLELHDNLDGLLAASVIDIARLNRLLDAVGV